MKYYFFGILALVSINAHAAQITSYEIQPNTIKAGKSTKLKVIGHYDDSTTADLTGFTFSSSGVSIVSGTYAYGSSVGQYSVMATNGEVSAPGQILVTPGNASKLVYVSGNNQSGSHSSQMTVVVKVLDSFNNPLANVPVSWDVVSGGGNFSSISQVVLTNSSGMSSNVYTTGPGPGIETFIAHTVSPVSGVGSYSFSETILPDPSFPAKMVFVSPPATAANQNVVMPSVSISYQDIAGNPALTSKSVTLVPYKNSVCTVLASGTLSGAVASTNNTSSVTFPLLSYDKAETIYLSAQSAGLPSVCSSYIKVSPASLGPSKLAFIQQPSTGTQGKSLFVAPRVAIKDNLNKTMASSTNSVVLSAYTDSSCSAPASNSLTGTSSTNAISGLATFSRVAYPSSGSLYLKAESAGLTSACSAMIAVAAASPQGPSFAGVLDTSFGINNFANIDSNQLGLLNFSSLSENGSHLLGMARNGNSGVLNALSFNKSNGSTLSPPVTLTADSTESSPVPGTDIIPVIVAVQSDGKILFSGPSNLNFTDYQGSAVAPTTGLGRLNADGSLDTSFGTNGVVYISPISGSNMRSYLIKIKGNFVYLAGELVQDSALYVVKFSLLDGSWSYPDVVSFSGFGYNSMKMDISDTGVVKLAYWEPNNFALQVAKISSNGSVVTQSPPTSIDSNFDIGGIITLATDKTLVYDNNQNFVQLNSDLSIGSSWSLPSLPANSAPMGMFPVSGGGVVVFESFPDSSNNITMSFFVLDSNGSNSSGFKSAVLPALANDMSVAYNFDFSSSYMSDSSNFYIWGTRTDNLGHTVSVMSRFK